MLRDDTLKYILVGTDCNHKGVNNRWDLGIHHISLERGIEATRLVGARLG